jgi:hypothetical protein
MIVYWNYHLLLVYSSVPEHAGKTVVVPWYSVLSIFYPLQQLILYNTTKIHDTFGSVDTPVSYFNIRDHSEIVRTKKLCGCYHN